MQSDTLVSPVVQCMVSVTFNSKVPYTRFKVNLAKVYIEEEGQPHAKVTQEMPFANFKCTVTIIVEYGSWLPLHIEDV